MTTTQVLVTALPLSRAAGADAHLTAFVTHKLVPDHEGATLAEFPAARDWVDTLQAGELQLLASHLAEPLPLDIVPGADAAAWRAVFPPSVPVAGFPAPAVSAAPWKSFPASRTGDAAVDLHLHTLTAAPTRRPGVLGSPVLSGLLQRLSEHSPALRELLSLAADRAGRAEQLLQRRMTEARATLRAPRTPYPTEDRTIRSAVEILLDDVDGGADGDERITAMLDDLLDADLSQDPELRLLVDAHASRRYYQRPEAATKYLRQPTPGVSTPRPPRPDPDFHARAASFGSTPALLRRLGLAVDLRLGSQALAALDGADWVAVRFVPPEAADLVRLAPPRTRVVVAPDTFRAAASDAWVDGALPLGDERYVVLDVDPDASGLKVEQHLRGLPRLVAAEVNGDPATSAPATLRSTGFALARSDRVGATRDQVARAEQMTTPPDRENVTGPEIGYDDLVRGLRLEVWDDVSRAWHSLHERRVDVTADPGDGTGPVAVLEDAADTGFLQLSGLNRVPGNDANPYYLHEVFAGWDGWSLSAPRPGKVVVHRGGDEQVLDAPPDDPATGVHVSTRVQPGSLPALRYGRSYSFRVLGVDLAGNSVPYPRLPGAPAGPPHSATGSATATVEPATEPTPEPATEATPEPATAATPEATTAADVEAAALHLARLREIYAARDAGGLLAAARDRVLQSLPEGRPDTGWLTDPELARPEPAPSAAPRGLAEVDEILALLPRTASGAGPAESAVAGEAGGEGGGEGGGESSALLLDGSDAASAMHLAAVATRHLAGRAGTWRVRPQLDVDPALLAEVAAVPGQDGRSGRAEPRIVTAPRPFLRWDPVPPPTLVARRPLGTGEQLSRLVIRSGVPAGSPEGEATSERHVVPPKGTQREAETAGRFDFAIGSSDHAEQRRAYAIALRERGTLLDRFVPDLDNPGATVEQPGIALHQRPGANPVTLVTLDEITAQRDTPLGEGQYVVHDVDQLSLPYLPDPYAAGVALVFYDAGPPHLLPEPRVLQAVALPFPGEWPRLQPLRLVLAPADPVDPDRITARLDGSVISVGLPAGVQVRVAMSSSVRRSDLAAFGLWRSHLASTIDPDGDGTASRDDVIAAAVLVRAAESGWTWWLTPSTDVRLVHAVPAPVRPPRLRGLRVVTRPAGLALAQLGGIVDVHGASTDRLIIRARWTERVDDPATAEPMTVTRDDVVVNSPVADRERFGALTLVDFLPFGPSETAGRLAEAGVGLHRALHTFPDTHFRRITYTPSGLTRYREFFAAADVPGEDDPALRGDSVVLDIPSSARPAAPDLVDAVPLLRWEQGTEPDQPFALRRVRRSGLRLWLRRPWFSSGDGELLGVVLGVSGTEPDSSVSIWGRDPVYGSGRTGDALALPLVAPAQLLVQSLGGGVEREPARPVLPEVDVPLLDLPDAPVVRVLAYEPEYHPAKGRWHVDVALDDGPALWPFVRLAVARYQPNSIEGCELSPVGLSGWVQPLPARTLTVARPAEDRVRVTLTGALALLRTVRRGEDAPIPPEDELDADSPAGSSSALDRILALSRTVSATVQVLPDGATDLEWVTVTRRRLPAVGVGNEFNFRVTWSGELALPPAAARPVPLELRTPGTQKRWRVLVEEHELLDSDPVDEPNASGSTTITPRLVYADEVPL